MDNGIAVKGREHELKAEMSSIFSPAKLKLDFLCYYVIAIWNSIVMFIFSKRLDLENDVAEPFVLFWTNESHMIVTKNPGGWFDIARQFYLYRTVIPVIKITQFDGRLILIMRILYC